MIVKGSSTRRPAQPVDPLFVDRWSPRAMSGEPLADAQLMTLFEAARWAPSSNNFQPWRMLYAKRDTPHWPVFLGLLNENNQQWAQRAAVLVLFISRLHTDKEGNPPCITHSFDTGAAWMSLALQGWISGLVVHGMQGLDYARARTELRIPDEFHVEAIVAIGHPADKSVLAERQQAREFPSDRRPVAQTVGEGPFKL